MLWIRLLFSECNCINLKKNSFSYKFCFIGSLYNLRKRNWSRRSFGAYCLISYFILLKPIFNNSTSPGQNSKSSISFSVIHLISEISFLLNNGCWTIDCSAGGLTACRLRCIVRASALDNNFLKIKYRRLFQQPRIFD